MRNDKLIPCNVIAMADVSLSPVQRRILEFAAEHDIYLTPSTIFANIDYSKDYVSKETKNLARMGLIQSGPGTTYRITDAGREHLADLDSDD